MIVIIELEAHWCPLEFLVYYHSWSLLLLLFNTKQHSQNNWEIWIKVRFVLFRTTSTVPRFTPWPSDIQNTRDPIPNRQTTRQVGTVPAELPLGLHHSVFMIKEVTWISCDFNPAKVAWSSCDFFKGQKKSHESHVTLNMNLMWL